jgi:hypothetical protein
MDLSIGQIIFWAVAFWFFSQVIFGVMDAHNIVQLKNHLGEIKRIKDLIHEVKVEKHGEMEYWFDSESDTFLGQGKTVEEVIEHVKKRFPDHIFLLQGTGGVSKQTDWKLLDVEEFKKVKLNIDDL